MEKKYLFLTNPFFLFTTKTTVFLFKSNFKSIILKRCYSLNPQPQKIKVSAPEHLLKIKTFTEHDEEIKSILVGNLLGDGYLRLNRQTASIHYKYSEKSVNYVQTLYEILHKKNYCKTKSLTIRAHFNKYQGKSYSTVRFETYGLPSFTDLHNLFYRPATETDRLLGRGNERFIKKIPKTIETMLTPQALAFWCMDDGSFVKRDCAFKIYTDAFTYEEVVLLKHTLKICFELNVNIHKHYTNKKTNKLHYTLYFPKLQTQKLFQIIKPFVIPAMYYKIGLPIPDHNNVY